MLLDYHWQTGQHLKDGKLRTSINPSNNKICIPVTVTIDTDVEPESGRIISSATHSTLLKHVNGVDFILKGVRGPAMDSSIRISVELQ